MHDLERDNALLRKQVDALSKQLKRTERDDQFLLERFRARMAKIFGRSAERQHSDQLKKAFEDRGARERKATEWGRASVVSG